MKVVLGDRHITEEATRGYMQQALIEIAKEDDKVICMDADLRMRADFVTEFPEKNYDCGIQEANAIGVCCGMSATGLKPYFHTFAPFATRRTFDTIFISGGYSKLNVKIMGMEAGICASENGGTHEGFEDIGLMRMVPDGMVFDVCDGVEAAAVIRLLKDVDGVQYIRFWREPAPQIYAPETEFELGKGMVLREGKDVTIIAIGIMVITALEAADKLAEEGIEATVVDMYTVKPIDKDLIIKCAEETGAIVTAENHNVIGGLGSAVSEVTATNIPVPVEFVGVMDRYGEVGDVPYLREAFGLTVENIVEKAKKAVSRK